MTAIRRCEQNPLIIPSQVKPSREDFKVEGVFNCGVTKYQGEVILLCRVAESVHNTEEDKVVIPMVKKIDGVETIVVETISKSEHPDYDFSDSRSVWTLSLTHI